MLFIGFTALYFVFFAVAEAVKFGAIFRSKGDEHLASAFAYAVNYFNKTKSFGTLEYKIEYIRPGHLHEISAKACQLFEVDKIVALFGSTDEKIHLQLRHLATKVEIPYLSVNDDYSINTIHTRRGEASYKQNETQPEFSTNLNLFPQWHLVDAVSDLIRYWKWNKITIVYRENRRIERLAPFIEDHQFSQIGIGIVHVKDGNFLEAAKLAKEHETCRRDCNENAFNRLLIDMDGRDVHEFLLAAMQVGLIELKHWFLLTSLVIFHTEMISNCKALQNLRYIDTELFRHNHARFIGMDVINPNTSSEYPRADLLKKVRAKWNESHSASKYYPVSQAILMFDAVLMAADGYKNLSSRRALSAKDTAKCRKVDNDYKPLSYGTQLFEAMRDSMAKGMSGDLQMTPLGNRKNFTFNIDLLGYEGVLDNIGYWEPHSDVLVNLTKDSKAQLKYIEEGNNVKVSDELKPHFRVTTIIERPYVMYRRNHYDFHGNQKFEGFCIDLLTELSRDLGFTFTIHEVKDKKYGNDISGNGTWDGMVGEILRGEADMAVAPLTVNFKRAEVVDFTKPFLSLGISILFKIPDDQQPDLFSFLNPLSLETWFWVLIAAAFITFGMYCVARLTPYEWNLNFSCCTAHQPQPASDFVFVDNVPVADQPAIDDHPPQIELSNNYSFWNTMWYVTSTMLKGGCDFGPRAVSTRLLGGTWWVFTLVITSAYTANLAAVLTVSRTYVPIKNLDDLANQTQIAYGTINGGSTMQFFQESKISIHSKMWQYMATRQVFVKNNEQGVARVLSDNYAYLMESTSLEYEVQQNCNLTHVGGVLGSKGYGIALEKRSEWTDRISRQILLYAKRGIIELVKTKWWRSKGGSCSGPGSSVKQQRLSLNMQNVSGLFVILFVGLILAVLSVIVEFCIRSGQNAKADKKSFHAEVVQELRFALKLNDARHHRVIGKTATFFQIKKLNAEAPTAERPAQGARSNQSPTRAQSKGSPTTSTTAFKRTLTPQIEVETFC